MLSVVYAASHLRVVSNFYCFAECRYAECREAECLGAIEIMWHLICLQPLKWEIPYKESSAFRIGLFNGVWGVISQSVGHCHHPEVNLKKIGVIFHTLFAS
jgi:hypothetical protein